MNAQMLLENFRSIANAPGGVKQLRELILQLGVQGKLVEQQPDDISAFDCIKQADDPVMDIALNNSIPVPKGWISVPLGCVIASNIGGGTPSKNNPSYWNGNISWASVKDVQHHKFIESTIDKITEEGLQKSSSNLIPPHHLIVVTRMGLGKIAINKIPIAINQDLRAIKPTQAFDLDYAYLLFKSLNFVGKGVTVKGITVKELHAQSILLPPIEEQRRIVSKVDELMALCDKLEAQQQERERRFPVLSRACHARFVESPSLDNLRAIFDEVGAVSTEDLRKTILDLAVQGRLVRQELSDPVPSETFDQIKPIKTINDRFPRSWIISKYENLTDLITSGSRGWKEYYSNSGAIFVRAQNIKTDCLILNDIAYVSLPNRAEGKRSLIKRWDILITITGANVTKTALVKDDISEAYVSQHIALTRPKWPEMAEWLYLCFVSPAIGRGELERLAYGDKPGLNLNNIRDLKFPIPPLNEQHRIVAKVNQLMALIDKMEEQQARKAKVAQTFAQAAVAAITGTEIKEPEKMKAPKTELISRLQTRNAPNAADPAPLTKLLTEHNGELPAKALWQRSGLEIDAFYQQLRTEMANGWIIEPEKAVMKEIEAD